MHFRTVPTKWVKANVQIFTPVFGVLQMHSFMLVSLSWWNKNHETLSCRMSAEIGTSVSSHATHGDCDPIAIINGWIAG